MQGAKGEEVGVSGKEASKGSPVNRRRPVRWPSEAMLVTWERHSC